MSAITFDGQSFMIDGRRVWLVSGTIEYARIPRDQWADRIALAKSAGLNCVTTSVHWARHEARPGQFDFSGEHDLRHFLEILKDAGLMAVLRMGPFQGGGLDLGGLPAWLLTQNNVSLRTNNAPFLEACSRFLGAVSRQVRDLQATNPGGGPVVLVQSESGYTCGHDQIAQAYLGELVRYLRESGIDVPVINANDLWQGVEGEIDGWTGMGRAESPTMLPDLRQLAVVRPTQPRVVIEYRLGVSSTWGGSSASPVTGYALSRGLAEVLASGSQFNLEPFASGTHMGFFAGRLGEGPAAFVTPSDDRGAPVGEGGVVRESYAALRRVALFASRFGRVLSHLDPRRQSVSLLPHLSGHALRGPGGRVQATSDHEGHAVVHATGSQGGVAFVFAPSGPNPDKRPADPATLLLPDGTVLPVYLGSQSVVWCLMDTRLMGRAQMDYCNLSAIAMAGKVLLLSGPAGSPGRLSINGADVQVEVPRDDEPLLLSHEGVMLAVVRDEALGKVHVGDDALYLGVDGLTLQGEPIVPAWGTRFRKITGEGLEVVVAEEHPKPKVMKAATPPPPAPAPVKGKGKGKGKGKVAPPPPPPPPVVEVLPPNAALVPPAKSVGKLGLSSWQAAGLDDYVDGSGPRYASIPGPADLATMGAAYGYGWYRLTLKNGSSRKARVAFPFAADRLAIFDAGEPSALLGVGPGASFDATVHLSRGEQRLVVLAENLGRYADGALLGEGKGVLGPLWEVSPLKLGRPSLEKGVPLEPLAFKTPLWHLHRGDATDPLRFTWHLPGKRKGPVMLHLQTGTARGLVVVNDKPVRYFDAAGPGTVVLDEATMSSAGAGGGAGGGSGGSKGGVTVQLAVLGRAEDYEKSFAEALTAHAGEECLSQKAEWAFAKWERPAPHAFAEAALRSARVPRWWRATFTPATTRVNLWLDTAGLTKGQAYVNGHHLGRYFTQTAEGKAVGPQTRLLVPGPFLMPGRPNEVVLFDEHGASPAKVKLMPLEG